MMPLYRYMDSNPYQRNQTFSFPQYHNPGFVSNPSMVCEPWPYGGNHGYPMPCHSCCNHNFRPSYPHLSIPSPQHFYGAYPVPHPEAYPVPYVPPPPHYSMEIPKYEYDKMAPRNYHCCGCPNHVCHQNVDKGVKIEEQGSDVVDKKADLDPVHMNNNHYPTLWFPPETMNGREQRKVSEPEVVEETKIPTDSKPPEGLKSQGDQGHIWFPYDLNDIGAPMQGGNREPRQEQQVEDKKKEFPFPIFWMPPYQEAGKKDKNVNASRDHKTEDEKKQIPFPFFLFPYGNKQEEVRKEGNRDVNSAPKVVPMNSTEGGITKEAGTNEEKPAGQDAEERNENTTNVKSIVVKQMDPHEEEKNSEDAERRERSVPVKQVEENVGNKPSGTSVKRQSSSPKKSSELPPVCLRVDPLPRKKANSSSRSPSPPAQKGHKKEEPFKKENATEVVDRTISENKDPMHTSKIPTNSKEDVSRNPTVGESEKDGDRCEAIKDEGAQKVADGKSEETNKPTETAKSVADGKLKRKTLLDVEAAVLIQSAFRGFEVRRWEPLKKLKQIADIREQVADIRNRISTLETSDLQKDDKQRVIIGETIMRLLLKLDTVQGLLPSLRDVRRSLARELVVLQEKLDEFNAKKSQNPTQEVSTVNHMEELGVNANNGNCMLEQQREEVTGLGEGLPDGVSDSSHHGTDHCQGEMLQNVEHEPDLRTKEPGHCNHRELHAAAEDGEQERQVESCLKSEDNGSAPIVETKDDVVGEQSYTRGMAVGDAEMENGSTQLGQCSEAPSLVEGNHTLTGNSSEAVNINVETREPGELPQGVTDDEPAMLEPGKDEQVEVLPDVSLPNGCACVMEKDLEMQELAEMSRGMIDEHNALTESTILEHGVIDEHKALNESTILEHGVIDEHKALNESTISEPEIIEQVEVSPDVTSSNACAYVTEKEAEMPELAELPWGMIDEHNALTESTILEPEIVEQVQLSPDVTLSNACAYVTEKEAEMQELAELPWGMTDKHNALNESKEIEEVGVVKEDDSLQSGEEHHVAFDVSSQPDGTSNTDQLEQQREGAVEEQPLVRLEQQVEIGSQEDEGRPSDSVLDLEVELQPQEQVRKDDLPLASESIETQALSLPVQTEAHDVVHEDGPLDIIHDHHSGQPIEDEAPIERITKDSEHPRAETVIEDTKMQESNLECEDKRNALPNVPENVVEDVFSETRSAPVQKSDSLPEKQVAIEASSIDVDVTEFESGRKLIEENEKLRAMMLKFMEAGNEQLQAISNLTGRVKDLEKKLARKKKVRGRRLPSRARPSNNRSKMDAGFAM